MGAVGLEPTMFVYPVKSRVPSPLGEHSRRVVFCDTQHRFLSKPLRGWERPDLNRRPIGYQPIALDR
jgi:hypothetical protein